MATEKQTKAAQKLVGTGGNVTAAMREAGYKENTINTPSKLTGSKAWPELMEKYYPDEKITKIQNKLLRAALLRDDMFNLIFTEKEIKKIISSAGGKVSLIKKFPKRKETKDQSSCTGYWKAYFTIPDHRIIDSVLDKILKSKGRYVQNIKIEDKRKYGSISDEDLLAVASGEKEIEEVVND